MSSSFEWHRHSHAKILVSYASLSAEQRGVGYTLLDLIYDRQGPLIENERVLAARMNMGKAKFTRIRDELIALGKFFITEDGFLMNKYAEQELEKISNLSETRAKSGRKGGKSSGYTRKKSKQNNQSDDHLLKQNRSRGKDRESTIAPHGANSTPLPPEGALALETLRASVGQGEQKRYLEQLEMCITGWRDGEFIVTGRYSRDNFSATLRGPLRTAGITLGLEQPTPPEPQKHTVRPAPTLVSIDGARQHALEGQSA